MCCAVQCSTSGAFDRQFSLGPARLAPFIIVFICESSVRRSPPARLVAGLRSRPFVDETKRKREDVRKTEVKMPLESRKEEE